jgi:CDP-glucose 4,6-dehydratase
MPAINANASSWSGRSVVVTGHTGFKGGWLSLWLTKLGTCVHGLALDPPTNPSFFAATRLTEVMASDTRGDIRDPEFVKKTLSRAKPDIVFHLAAQPSVRDAYREPVATVATNVLGTTHVLEAARTTGGIRAVIVITTDKVYENRESQHAYVEADELGGHDLYSASKAATEIIAASFRRSFPAAGANAAQIATVRAGNVIGGGDWSPERLVPDCLRAFESNAPLTLRFPASIRPWQHVLDPLGGYIRLAEMIMASTDARYAKAWNFGPDLSGDATVGKVAESLKAMWGATSDIVMDQAGFKPHEAGVLRLNSTLAREELGWTPRWAFGQSLEATTEWHKAWLAKKNMREFSLEQIKAYEQAVKVHGAL